MKRKIKTIDDLADIIEKKKDIYEKIISIVKDKEGIIVKLNTNRKIKSLCDCCLDGKNYAGEYGCGIIEKIEKLFLSYGVKVNYRIVECRYWDKMPEKGEKTCNSCGAIISEKTKKCLYCNYIIPQKRRKK